MSFLSATLVLREQHSNLLICLILSLTLLVPVWFLGPCQKAIRCILILYLSIIQIQLEIITSLQILRST